MMSAHPAASSRCGAVAMIPVSATIASGGWAATLTFPESVTTEAREDAIPSWDAAVGTLTN